MLLVSVIDLNEIKMKQFNNFPVRVLHFSKFPQHRQLSSRRNVSSDRQDEVSCHQRLLVKMTVACL
jgi:hypothetical protein